MIAFTRTQSTTALLCLSFLFAGAGCQQQADTQAPTDTAADTEITDEDQAAGEHSEHEAHDDHDHAGHDDHDDHDHAEHNHDDHDGHDHAGHDHADMTAYNCQPDQLIEAHYETDDTATAQEAHLLIDGIEYDLTAMAAPAANSATIYETDIGLNNDAGMRWQLSADGQTATLSSKTLNDSIPQAQEAVLFECQQAAS